MKSIVAFALFVAVCASAQTTKVTRDPGPKKAENVATSSTDWRTPAEISDYRTTPRYAETMTYVHRLAAAAPKQIKIETFGATGEGRDLVAIIVSKDGEFDPAKVHAANRPIVYIQNAIHAGEMDGKDASLALLREIVVTKKLANLIDRAVLVVIPIYNADGHERFGPYNRINQNGPEQMGWRTQARQLNLNRDYMKADAPETRAFLKLWNRYLPDFFVDDHVTDGADYQYDVTYFLDADAGSYQPVGEWIRKTFVPQLETGVNDSGHLIAPYMDFIGATPESGISIGQSTTRFATGYINNQNRPSMLVEMHMMKDYKTRVLGNYETLRVVLELVNREADNLIRLNREADQATIAAKNSRTIFPLLMEPSGETQPFRYKGYKWETGLSEISGSMRTTYTHEPVELDIPRQSSLKVTRAVTVPAAYVIPAQWTTVIDVLSAHGIAMRKLTASWTGVAEFYRCQTPQWAVQPFEGHHLATWPRDKRNQRGEACEPVREKQTFPAGSVVVPTAQRAAKIAMHFLEPEAPDSAVAWGYFDSIFEQKEYGEAYVLEKLARDMMAKDPKLKAEFEKKVVSDHEFSANPYGRLNWFYKHSPWWDDRIGFYPVGRLDSMDGLPLAK
ncbi:MAG TPA: M14 family metallopeptidase [Clostridia bacterium]|nr:M14 family metallopeptidase [Clostridia bacterium]